MTTEYTEARSTPTDKSKVEWCVNVIKTYLGLNYIMENTKKATASQGTRDRGETNFNRDSDTT